MNNDETKSKSEWTAKVARQNAAFDRVATVQNTTILFWFTSAIIIFVISYAPATVTGIKWLGLVAKIIFEFTIGLWVYADGRTRNFNGTPYVVQWRNMYIFLSIVIPPIGLPLYLVHSRGWLGAGKSTLRFAGYLLLASVIWFGVVGVLLMFGIHETGTPTITF